MDAVLAALGWPITAVHRLLVAGYIAALTAAFTIVGYLVARPFGDSMFIVQFLLWIPWLIWLGHIFPRHHLGLPQRNLDRPYRHAFFVQITPGISWNFAQMTRPGLAGLDRTTFEQLHPSACLIGLVLAALGATMIGSALRAIGVARAMFLGEYDECHRKLVTDGIYGWLRHPLFVGGMVVSLGAGTFFLAPAPLGMALANVAVLPAYLALEDVRCRKVHARYGVYRNDVSGLIPVETSTRWLHRRVRGRP
jgi:protein-S-isoprenylcysteine O-methyltransferase Ste14